MSAHALGEGNQELASKAQEGNRGPLSREPFLDGHTTGSLRQKFSWEDLFQGEHEEDHLFVIIRFIQTPKLG